MPKGLDALPDKSSRYIVMYNQCTEWPLNDLGQYEIKGTPYTYYQRPESRPIFTPIFLHGQPFSSCRNQVDQITLDTKMNKAISYICDHV